MQHEFGIYGGPAGSYLLGFLSQLKRPVVTTLHTVLKPVKEKGRHPFRSAALGKNRCQAIQ